MPGQLMNMAYSLCGAPALVCASNESVCMGAQPTGGDECADTTQVQQAENQQS